MVGGAGVQDQRLDRGAGVQNQTVQVKHPDARTKEIGQEQAVRPGTARQHVDPRIFMAKNEQVVTVAAVQPVIAQPAQQIVVASSAVNQIVAGRRQIVPIAYQQIVAGTAA